MIEILQKLSQTTSTQSDTLKTLNDTLFTVINAATVDSMTMNFRSDAIDSLVS